MAALDARRKRIGLDDGATREFGAVVLATGAEPVRLTIPEDHGPRIHYLRTLDDSRAIIRAAEGARRAVVVGERRDCTVRYSRGGRVAAVATVFRDRASLEAERVMEKELELARAA